MTVVLVGYTTAPVITWKHLINADPVLVSLDYVVRYQVSSGVSQPIDWCRERYWHDCIRPLLMTLLGKYRPKQRPNTDEAQALLQDDHSLVVATDYLYRQLPQCLYTCECKMRRVDE
ncbi:MAG TPA: hypothetical protein VHV10_02050 [Ktedonobacteraceae bacterium]|jgi:hypothetical protein|nr:hypothetical protein [Ktedonobacteraceae bacterium]